MKLRSATGKLMTEEYRVEGPVMIALTTTAAEISPRVVIQTFA